MPYFSRRIFLVGFALNAIHRGWPTQTVIEPNSLDHFPNKAIFFHPSALLALLHPSRSLTVFLVNIDQDLSVRFLQDLHQRDNFSVIIKDINTSYQATNDCCNRCVCSQASYIYLVDNVELLLLRWDQIHTRQHCFNTQAEFGIVVLSNTHNNTLNDISNRFKPLLEILWKKYGIVKVSVGFVQKMTEIMIENVVFYQPFFHNHGSDFGRVTSINVDDCDKNEPIKKFHSMNGYPLRLSMFQRSGVPLGTDCSDKLKLEVCYGFDGFVLKEMIQYMGFTPDIHLPPEVHEYGYYFPNGTSTGSLGDVVHGRADVAFNARFVKYYGTDRIAFTSQVRSDDLCIVVQKAQRMPSWRTFVRCFDPYMEIVIIAMYIFLCGLLYSFKRCRQFYLKERNSLDLCQLYLDAIHPFLSMAMNRVPSVSSQRMIVICSSVLGFILVSAFQGKLVTIIGHPMFSEDIDTLGQLDRSGLLITTGSQSLFDTFPDDGNSLMHSLRQKISIVTGNNALNRVAENGNVAALIRKSTTFVTPEYFHSKDGSNALHLVKECPRSYYLSYVVPRHSPYREKIDHFIIRLFESGILIHWTKTKVLWKEGKGKSDTSSNSRKVFSLIDLQLPFYLLMIGLTSSTIVFVCEIGWRYKTKLRKM